MAPSTYGATSRQGKRGAVGKAKLGRGTTGTGANPNMRKKSKLVVTFDPDKRKEYLTGFHKRKQERRRFGLDMEAFKVKKRQLEAKKQRREEHKEKLAALNLLDDGAKSEDEDEQGEEEEDGDDSDSDASDENENDPKSVLSGAKAVTKVMTFNDDFTQGKFGDVVTVTTSVGDLQSDSDESGSDLEPSDDEEQQEEDADKPKHPAFRQKRKKFDKEQHLTLFQRIQQQRKGKALPSKRSKLKDARAARKAMMGGKKGHSAPVTGKKRGAEDADGGSSAVSKITKKLKMKRQQGGGGGNKRNKKR